MAWILVILSGFLEVAWALGLKASHGFTRPLPALLTVLGMVASFALLAIAVRELPIGTAYAVWVGIGVAGAAIFGAVFHAEPMTLGRVMSLLLVLLGIVGLRLTSPPS